MLRYLILILFFLTPLSTTLHSGAWGQKKKSYYLKFAASYLRSGKEFNYLGQEQDILGEDASSTNNVFRDFSLIGYFEYGISNRLTITGDFLFKFLASEWISQERYYEGQRFLLNSVGFADLTVSARFVFMDNPLVLSFQSGIVIPLGYDTTPENDGPRLGNGETAFQALLLFGKSLYPLPLYITAGAGYRSRGDDLHDEILYNFEVGYSKNRLLVKLYLEGVKNTVAPPDLFGQTIELPLPGGGGVTPNILFGDQDFIKLSPSFVYKLNSNLSAQFELTDVLYGKDIISGISYTFGIIVEH
ncbi:MAG: hypothetical protein ACE5GL_08040 [Calditrichia bacterium]